MSHPGPGYFQLEVFIPNGYLALSHFGGHRLVAEILDKKKRTERKRFVVRVFWGLVVNKVSKVPDL